MSAFRTPIQNLIAKVSVCAASLVGSMSGEVAGRDGAHHDDDNAKGGLPLLAIVMDLEKCLHQFI